MKDIAIIYHGNCPDGFGGAWAAWKKFGDQADYIPANHTDPIPKIDSKEIYFIDFIYKSFNAVDFPDKKITVIDHHITNESLVKTFINNSFDIGQSGAVLAWKYFFPGKAVPKLLQHVEDVDLWKFNLPNTKEISSFLMLFDFDFSIWDKISSDLETDSGLNNAIFQGETILKYEANAIKRAIENYAQEVEFEGYKTLVVNHPNFLASQLGHALVVKMPPIGIVWSQRNMGKNVFSLRSDGTVKNTAVADIKLLPVLR